MEENIPKISMNENVHIHLLTLIKLLMYMGEMMLRVQLYRVVSQMERLYTNLSMVKTKKSLSVKLSNIMRTGQNIL